MKATCYFKNNKWLKHAVSRLFETLGNCMVETAGVEPASENSSTEVSPSSVFL